MKVQASFFLFLQVINKILEVRSLVWTMFAMILNLCPLLNLMVSDVGDTWQGS